jgi:hypothetical protein
LPHPPGPANFQTDLEELFVLQKGQNIRFTLLSIEHGHKLLVLLTPLLIEDLGFLQGSLLDFTQNALSNLSRDIPVIRSILVSQQNVHKVLNQQQMSLHYLPSRRKSSIPNIYMAGCLGLCVRSNAF